MEAKQIFREFNKRFYLTQWNNAPDGGEHYEYLGVGEDFEKENFEKILMDFFGEKELYVSITAGKSFWLPIEKIADEILPFLGKKEIGIMNFIKDKILFISYIATFKTGIYKEYPKSREREAGTPLSVNFHANMIEEKTKKISEAIESFFPKIETALRQDYGGVMEFLWIDVVLIVWHDTFNFRFQKRVGIQDISGTSVANYYYNVGHYSVKPDFDHLKTLQDEGEICRYIFGLLYDSMAVLEKKSKSLGGFNAQKFRTDFKTACEQQGIIF